MDYDALMQALMGRPKPAGPQQYQSLVDAIISARNIGQTPANFGPPIETDKGLVPAYRGWQTPNQKRDNIDAFRAATAPGGMNVGPSWLGLDVPIAGLLGAPAARGVEDTLGLLTTFAPGISDAQSAWDGVRYLADAGGQALNGNWKNAGALGTVAAMSLLGAAPGVPSSATRWRLTPQVEADVISAANRYASDLEEVYRKNAANARYGVNVFTPKEMQDFLDEDSIAKILDGDPAIKAAYDEGRQIIEYGDLSSGLDLEYHPYDKGLHRELMAEALDQEGLSSLVHGHIKSIDDLLTTTNKEAQAEATAAYARSLGLDAKVKPSGGPLSSTYVLFDLPPAAYENLDDAALGELTAAMGSQKLRFSDHANQSSMHEPALFNVAEGQSSLSDVWDWLTEFSKRIGR